MPYKDPEQKRRYQQSYQQRPEVKQRRRKFYRNPEVKARQSDYYALYHGTGKPPGKVQPVVLRFKVVLRKRAYYVFDNLTGKAIGPCEDRNDAHNRCDRLRHKELIRRLKRHGQVTQQKD